MKLEFRDLVFEYAYPDRKRILDNLSCSFSVKKFNVIIGANGSGKTTFLKVLQGSFYKNYQGTISLNQSKKLTLDNLNFKQRAEYIFKVEQEVLNLLVPYFTVGEHLVLAKVSKTRNNSFFKQITNTKSKQNILEELNEIGITDIEELWKKRVYELSGGQQKILSLAMLAIKSPKVALLDEPTANLDNENSKMCFDTVRAIVNSSESIIIMVTHDLDLVVKYADNIYIMKNNKFHETINNSDHNITLSSLTRKVFSY